MLGHIIEAGIHHQQRIYIQVLRTDVDIYPFQKILSLLDGDQHTW